MLTVLRRRFPYCRIHTKLLYPTAKRTVNNPQIIAIRKFELVNKCYGTATEQQQTETLRGPTEKKEFQAETRMLLDIVARSLYSDKEVSSN